MPEAEIFYCPYCGEEDLRDDEAGWRCRTCLRSFAVHLAAVGRIQRSAASTPVERDLEQHEPEQRDLAQRDGEQRDGEQRDRDDHGRARNARPRDRLGRPLARGQIGVEPWPEDVQLSAQESLATAQALLDRGWPFQAHEVLESAWKAAPPPERRLWQGLAQLAVGLTHAARGNAKGAAALLGRGCSAIESYRDHAPHDIDAGGLADWAHAALVRIESGDGAAIELAPPALRAGAPHASAR